MAGKKKTVDNILKLPVKDIPDSLRFKVRDIRNRYAEKGEFTRDQIMPEVEKVVLEELSKVNINGYFARQLIHEEERRETSNKKTPEGFFPHERIVSIGDGVSCKVGKFNSDRILRRKRVIDANQIAQQRAWSEETTFLDENYEALKGHSKKTVIEDIMNEDGTPKGEPVRRRR